MKKIALIGGGNIKKYSIADVLWECIQQCSSVEYSFNIISLEDKDQLREFINVFKEDKEYVGFNVALPWKSEVTKFVDDNYYVHSDCKIINTVYKSENSLNSFNSDVLGITIPLKALKFIPKKILILGSGGAGTAVAYYLKKEYENSNIYLTEIDQSKHIDKFNYLNSIYAVEEYTFDLIINATPLGKIYTDRFPESYSSAIDLKTLKKISHSKTVIQEMNYFPKETLLLQMGKTMNLHIIPGYYMLVYQAIESFKKYFPDNSIDVEKVLEMISKRIDALEDSVCLKNI